MDARPARESGVPGERSLLAGVEAVAATARVFLLAAASPVTREPRRADRAAATSFIGKGFSRKPSKREIVFWGGWLPLIASNSVAGGQARRSLPASREPVVPGIWTSANTRSGAAPPRASRVSAAAPES